jgi:hypothetical protein
MDDTQSDKIWEFFAEYFDDSITRPGDGPVIVTARTMRLVGTLFDRSLLRQIVEAWNSEGIVKVLGDWDELEADTPSIEIFDYVSKPHIEPPIA